MGYYHYSNFLLLLLINSATILVKSINVNSKAELVQDRENLTFRLTVFYDESQAVGENCQLFILGDNDWFTGGDLSMKKVSQDTWQTDINYNSNFKGYTCNNCVSNTGVIHIGETLRIRILQTDDSGFHTQLGAPTKIRFPISQSSSYFPQPPEFIITPYFADFPTDQGVLKSYNLTHPIFGERNIPIYLPPGHKNPYKNLPVTFIIDANFETLSELKPQLDSWFGERGTEIAETIIVGFGDWRMDLQSLYGPDDRTNILTPVIGDVLACKNGSFEDLCNGCLNPNEIGNIEEMLKCCDVKQLGGNADHLLDWFLGDILNHVSENVLPGQVLTDRDNLAIIGYSFGGLFSCHAAWQRHLTLAKSACQSPSFWWPTNVTIPGNMFHFIETLADPKFTENRLPQKILIDVGGEEEDFEMIKGASLATQKMVELPYFKKDENIWFHVYPGKLHSEEAFIDRIWNALKIMWN